MSRRLRVIIAGFLLAAALAAAAADCAPARFREGDKRAKKTESSTCKPDEYESAVTRREKTRVELDAEGAIIISTFKEIDYRPTAGLIRLGFGLRPARGETLEIEASLIDLKGAPLDYKPAIYDEPPVIKTALSDPDLKIRSVLFHLENGGLLLLKTKRRIPRIEGFAGVYAAVYSASPLRVCRAEISLSSEIQKEAVVKISPKLKLFAGFYEKTTAPRQTKNNGGALDRVFVIEQMEGSNARTKLIELSTYKEWESLAASLYKKYAPSHETIKLVKSVFPDMPQDSSDAFVYFYGASTAAPRYCSNAEDFMFPAPIGRILSAKAGTCKDLSYVLAAALKARRFAPYVVFLNLRENIREDFPSDNFNHAVVAVKLSNGLWRFFDPTTGNAADAENKYYPDDLDDGGYARSEDEWNERGDDAGAAESGAGFAVDSSGSYMFLSVPLKKLRTRLAPYARPSSADAKLSFKEVEGGGIACEAEYLFSFRDESEKEPLFLSLPEGSLRPYEDAQCSAFVHEELGTKKIDPAFIIKARDADGRLGFLVTPPKNARRLTVTISGTAEAPDGFALTSLPFSQSETGKIEISCAKPLYAAHYAKEGKIAVIRGSDSLLSPLFNKKAYLKALSAYLKFKTGKALGILPSLRAGAETNGLSAGWEDASDSMKKFKPALIFACDDPKCPLKPPFDGVWSLLSEKEGNAVGLFPMSGACAKAAANPLYGSIAVFSDGSTRRLPPQAKDASALYGSVEINTDDAGGSWGRMTIKGTGGFACALASCRPQSGFPPVKAALFESGGEVAASWPIEIKLIGGDTDKKRLAFRLYPNFDACGLTPRNGTIVSTIKITAAEGETAQIDDASLYALKQPGMNGLKFTAIPKLNELEMTAEMKIDDGAFPPPPVINIIISK